MQANSEIRALLQLLDDPETEVYQVVSEKLLHYGQAAVPHLEYYWESVPDGFARRRAEELIGRVNFLALKQEFAEWLGKKSPDLLRGAALVAKVQYPGLDVGALLVQFDKIKKDVWLELNAYMTALEQVNVLNTMIFKYYKFQGHDVASRVPGHFFLNDLLAGKHGNAYSIGILYLALCEALDIPLFAVDIPRQFIFAYIDMVHNYLYPHDEGEHRVRFFLDPATGMLYTQKDVDAYLDKLNVSDRQTLFLPMTSKRIIYKMMEELALCYSYKKEGAKADELHELMQMLVGPEAL
jgi:Transglutaminase-like superfamily